MANLEASNCATVTVDPLLQSQTLKNLTVSNYTLPANLAALACLCVECNLDTGHLLCQWLSHVTSRKQSTIACLAKLVICNL